MHARLHGARVEADGNRADSRDGIGEGGLIRRSDVMVRHVDVAGDVGDDLGCTTAAV